VAFIGRVRKLARRAARAYLEQRKELGFPLLAADAPKIEPPARKPGKAKAEAAPAGAGAGRQESA
jgi:hypothetical protein